MPRRTLRPAVNQRRISVCHLRRSHRAMAMMDLDGHRSFAISLMDASLLKVTLQQSHPNLTSRNNPRNSPPTSPAFTRPARPPARFQGLDPPRPQWLMVLTETSTVWLGTSIEVLVLVMNAEGDQSDAYPKRCSSEAHSHHVIVPCIMDLVYYHSGSD